jgi:predicted O-methyltransferase YrrM
MEVFEFGCGSSTIYFSNRVKSVTSVEHDKNWCEKVSKTLCNEIKEGIVSLYHCELRYGKDEKYSNFAAETGGKYDIIVVDGRDRVNCIMNCLDSIKDTSVIILDNSDKLKYTDGKDFLRLQGFKRLDFYGIAPLIPLGICTSVFYRENNCLGI